MFIILSKRFFPRAIHEEGDLLAPRLSKGSSLEQFTRKVPSWSPDYSRGSSLEQFTRKVPPWS